MLHRFADGEPPASMRTGDDIARYGESVWQRYAKWWETLDDRKLARMLKTY